ncbi:MAG: thiamine phosphate synthase [Verrucomicrobiales bacterium]|jgi:thiamine-phosphate pyrophosphorylase|nr:thiamine phosphate synthase [Verrucomicrobiales bacterium]
MTRDEAMQKLRQAKLYAILDTGYAKPADWPGLAQKLIAGGVEILQIRAKQSSPEDIAGWTRELLSVSAPAGVLLIVNDYPEIARRAGANGCHVGQNDRSVAEVRKIVGARALIGKSTHSLPQALAAQQEGADYIGFGPIYATPTKPDYQPIGDRDLRRLTQEIHIPYFCIGGIKLAQIADLKAQGVARVVIVSALLQSDQPTRYAQEVCRRLAG